MYKLKKKIHHDNSEVKAYGSLSGSSVIGKELFYGSCKESKGNKFLSGNINFNYITPFLISDFDNREILLSDYTKLEWGPDKCNIFIFSEKLYDIIVRFNLIEHRIFDGKVLLGEDLIDVKCLQFLSGSIENYFDFKYSTFKVTNLDNINKCNIKNSHQTLNELLSEYSKKYDDFFMWEFDRSIMKPSFRKIDMFYNGGNEFYISERLKNALESATLESLQITECPINFEYSDEQ
ncbi:hypothetical protein [Flammeovirga aprica]|uniref:Uncharacterized protein n=1 Tax=Flammeovirga aprica JL-4 TaxID=694437 RepID=A0A7X9RYK7_9BACT|nr:hypothetical protein [Flammeovirga aprica]NME71017.1 hypothetical protein [Flammeovirga aprica JL-4]